MSLKIPVTIDGRRTEVPEGTTILEAAESVGIRIPTLCYLKGRTRLESCGVCVVSVQGSEAHVPSCASKVTPGMEVQTDTPDLRRTRRLALELLLSDHTGDCLAPCERACPAGIDIPGFLRHIRDGKPAESLTVILKKIAFPGVLGRVCPKFCERICRRGEYDEPVAICTLKRYPAEQNELVQIPYKPVAKPSSGKRVAIVGAGIVGLTAAYYLLLEGHDCVLYESRNRAGGALDHVIPEFRLPKRVLQTEIDRILNLGAEIRYNQILGRDIVLEDLRGEADAVLVAIGATRERLPSIPGSEFAVSGLDLLHKVADGCHPDPGESALVYGSGPTALDTSRTLLRLGAQRVTLAMQPSIDSSLFFKTWISDGLREGVEILDKVSQEKIEKLGERRFRCSLVRHGEEIIRETGSVFLAGHVEPDRDLLEDLGFETTHQGIRVDRHTLATNLEGVFAAGNIAQAGRYAVQGSAAGRRVALSIHAYLSGVSLPTHKTVDVRLHQLSPEEKEILFSGYPKRKRTENQRQYPSLGETGNYFEVDLGIPANLCPSEAARCLQCDCAAKEDCSLRELATFFGADPKSFPGERPPVERDTSHPDVIFESGKCIRCGRCIAIAEEHKEALGLTYIGRGFQVKVGVPFEQSLREGLRVAAEECAEACPTGALYKKR